MAHLSGMRAAPASKHASGKLSLSSDIWVDKNPEKCMKWKCWQTSYSSSRNGVALMIENYWLSTTVSFNWSGPAILR